MRIRLSSELIGMLREAGVAYDISYSDIAKKAIRKYSRIKPVLDIDNQETTYQGECYRLDIITDLPAPLIRAVLHWYLDMNRPKPDHHVNKFQTDKIEGKDYKVIQV